MSLHTFQVELEHNDTFFDIELEAEVEHQTFEEVDAALPGRTESWSIAYIDIIEQPTLDILADSLTNGLVLIESDGITFDFCPTGVELVEYDEEQVLAFLGFK